MNILILTHIMTVGGAERQFIQLAGELRRRGHNVRILTLHSSHPGWQWMQESDESLVTVLFDKVPVGSLELVRQFISAIRQLRRIFSEHRTQIAHAGNTGLTATLLWFASRGRSLPLMVWGQRGGLGLVRPGSNKYLHLVASHFSRLVSHSATLLLANSERGSRALHIDGLRCRRFEVVPNGIDTSRFKRDELAGRQLRGQWGFEESQHVIGWIGRLAPVKDLELFLRAAALVAETEANARFLVVGGNREKHQLRYRLLAGKLGIEDRITWQVTSEHMASVYSAIDMLCLSSISEGFPNVVAESMACGTPCVVTDVGAAGEIVSDYGIVVPHGSPDLLARGIAQMTERLEGLDRQALRHSIESRFSLDQHVAAMESLYGDLLVGNS